VDSYDLVVVGAGDCTSPLQFTHVGDEQGRLAAVNAFTRLDRLPEFAGGAKPFDDSGIPWVTFTDPEVGRVGMPSRRRTTPTATAPGSRS
jgi:pyruvate/2-oxoglutarate dehydrogenase complex dihydrolipoamide dehydrogenase (E3) component